MGIAQGKKADPAPLRLRRSRRSRPLARSSRREAVWLARPNSILGRRRGGLRMSFTSGAAWQAKRKKLWSKRRRPPPLGSTRATPASTSRQSSRQISARMQHGSISGAVTNHASWPVDLKAIQTARPSWVSLIGCARGRQQRLCRTRVAGLPLPSAPVRNVIRPQAVPPTRIAPIIANAWRHPCDDTPTRASASVA